MVTANKAIQVVLVDDSSLFRDRMATMLSALTGVQVAGQAADVPTGLTLIQEFRPDVLVLDIGLPEPGGIELLKTVKERSGSPLVIMLTNYNIRQLREKCFELGADHYFYKPVEFEKVLEVCEKLAAFRAKGNAAATDLPDQSRRAAANQGLSPHARP